MSVSVCSTGVCVAASLAARTHTHTCLHWLEVESVECASSCSCEHARAHQRLPHVRVRAPHGDGARTGWHGSMMDCLELNSVFFDKIGHTFGAESNGSVRRSSPCR